MELSCQEDTTSGQLRDIIFVIVD